MIDKTILPSGSVVREDDGLLIVEPSPSEESSSRKEKESSSRKEKEDDSFVPLAQRAEEDRPREKLMARGVEALTNAELFAILIGGGTRRKTAVELMQDILRDCNGKLHNLNRLTLRDLMAYNGIGEAKALTIIAAAELGRRRTVESMDDDPLLNEGEKVFNYMRPRVQDLNHEESWALLLNNAGRLMHCTPISKGGLTETSVDVRMVLKQALLHDSTCVILVHNHPSGVVRPSKADIQLTERLKAAAATMSIRLLDHVIVSDSDYYSFAEEGMI